VCVCVCLCVCIIDDSFIHIKKITHYSVLYVTLWWVHMCDVMHFVVWSDEFINVMWCIYTWCEALKYDVECIIHLNHTSWFMYFGSWFIHCDTVYSFMPSLGSFASVLWCNYLCHVSLFAWLIHMCDVTHSRIMRCNFLHFIWLSSWHDAYEWSNVIHSFTWHVRDMYVTCTWHVRDISNWRRGKVIGKRVQMKFCSVV